VPPVPPVPIDAPTMFPPDWNDADPSGETRLREVPSTAGTSSTGGESGPLAQGQAFGARYRILKLLGIGGMGAVYQAWDAELGMAVALKVIRPEATANVEVAREMERRFKQELVLARQVTHKNVVRIHDLGSIAGIKYITMPYLEGADLASVLEKSDKLSVPAALRLVHDVASGLVAAHEAGIVHRDLKPANIMVVDEHAVIMDFGIARPTASLVAPSGAGLTSGLSVLMAAARGATMDGAIVGTPQYMAPEQAKGEPVDQRADVYALGLILRDMLIGKRSVTGADASLIEELKRRMAQAPPPVRSIDSSIPEAVERLVSRCLEPDAAARFQTSAELVAALDLLDEHGEPLPIRRVVGMRPAMAAVVFFLVLLAGTWWLARGPAAPVAHEPVSVLIADFRNSTNDPTFDRALEPMLKRALEGAGFISAYDRGAIGRTLGVRPPETLDEQAARELAVKQGLGVVLSGSIGRRGAGYAISVKAAHTITGDVIASETATAATREQVLPVATKLVTEVRQALGDDASDAAQLFGMASLSATSLDVVRHYAAGQEAMSNNKFEDARQSYAKAVELDPKFGIGYQVLAVVSRNLGNLQDAEKYINEALKYLDGMTERERFSTRGMFYRITGDYQQCVKEYGDLIARYEADIVARNQLALCSTQLRDMPKALEQMRRVVQLLPQRVLFRDNLALYSNYAGDFQGGEQEARTIEEPDVYATLALAFAQLGQGQTPQASDTYSRLATFDAQGASFATSGLGDLAAYEGRFSDAARILTEGAAADIAANNADRAAAKFAALAHAHVSRGQTAAAVAAAEKAVANSKAPKIRFAAARVLAEAGEVERARVLATGLAAELQAEPQAYAKIVEGVIALNGGDPRAAVKVLIEANSLLDTWIGHLDLGRAYLEAGQFPQADSELDRCLKRRGEALSLFLDEEATYAYLPRVYYYQGRVREGLKNAGFADSYRAYLAIRGQSREDPLLADVRQRAGGN
jgi:tetratricopeptide (TPR) repeat protein